MYRVLVLDEDRSARYVFRRFPWRRFGFAVPEAAASGQEALEWLGEKKIDLLVADIRLPDMDGIEFLEAVQAKGEHVCTVLLSSYRDFSYAQQGIRLGVFDYLTKPFSAEAFGSLLQRAAIFLHRQQGVPTETMEKDTAREFLSSEHQERLELLLFSGSPEFPYRMESAHPPLRPAEFSRRCRRSWRWRAAAGRPTWGCRSGSSSRARPRAARAEASPHPESHGATFPEPLPHAKCYR